MRSSSVRVASVRECCRAGDGAVHREFSELSGGGRSQCNEEVFCGQAATEEAAGAAHIHDFLLFGVADARLHAASASHNAGSSAGRPLNSQRVWRRFDGGCSGWSGGVGRVASDRQVGRDVI